MGLQAPQTADGFRAEAPDLPQRGRERRALQFLAVAQTLARTSSDFLLRWMAVGIPEFRALLPVFLVLEQELRQARLELLPLPPP